MKEIIRIQNRPDGRVNVLSIMEGGDEPIVLVRGLEPNKSLDLVINTQTSVSVDSSIDLDVLKDMQGHVSREKFPTKITFKPQSRNMGIYATAFSIQLDFNDGSEPVVYLVISRYELIEVMNALIEAYNSHVVDVPCYLDRDQHFKMEIAGADRWRLTYTDDCGNLHHYIFNHTLLEDARDRVMRGRY